jgi:hypothetical protein
MGKLSRQGTVEFDSSALSADSRRVFESLPSAIREELLLDRDPHGNVQVRSHSWMDIYRLNWGSEGSAI